MNATKFSPRSGRILFLLSTRIQPPVDFSVPNSHNYNPQETLIKLRGTDFSKPTERAAAASVGAVDASRCPYLTCSYAVAAVARFTGSKLIHVCTWGSAALH